MFLFLLIISFLPCLYPLRKIWKLKNINVFDIFQIFTSLYYVLIPIKVLYWDLPEMQSEFINDFVTPICFLIFNGLLYATNFIWTNSYSSYYSPFNISNYIKHWDRKIYISDNYIYLFLIFFILLLITLTNYSSLSDENLEQNVTAGYGLGVGFFERIWLIFIYNIYPVLIFFNFKYLIEDRNKSKWFKRLSLISFIIGCVCVILATKTMMMFTVVFILLYFYSIRRFSITRKFVVKTLLVFSFVIFVIFPLSQGFRMVKQNLAISSGKIDFIQVFDAFINIDKNEKALLASKYERYQGRSLNVYRTLHWANTKDFRGDGDLTFMVYKYLFPQRITNTEEGNILADVYWEKGADIGESVLAWFVADLGFLGIFVSIVHFVIVLLIWILYKNFFLKLTRDPKIEILLVFFILTKCINIEENPSAYFHGFYSQWLICFVMYILTFKVVNMFKNNNKKRSIHLRSHLNSTEKI